MKTLTRTEYLDQLKSVNGTHDIKVITGVRRSGKSVLMHSYIEWIKRNRKNANIILIDFTLLKYEPLKEYHALNNYVESKYIEHKKNYVFIDEVQMCQKFELTINSLHSSGNYDIYITGSNAFLLSSDLATLFTGRTFEIEVFPFSFKEYSEYRHIDDIQTAFDQYMKDGGMAGSYDYLNQKDKYKYLNDVFTTLIIRDIRQKYSIKNTLLMERMIDFLMDNVSNLTTARKIAEALASNTDLINHKTVGKYLEYLCNAFAFYKVRRYDIQGKKYLASSDKYYLSDHAFRYARLGTKNLDQGRTLENVIAIELMRRGYEIYAGILYKKEIDFVAVKHSEKIYIQVSDDITSSETFTREVSPLLKIKDAYPKMLIARTKHDEYQYEGIRIIDAANWLLNVR